MTQNYNAKPKTIHLKDYQPPHYWVDTVNLMIDLNEDYTTVKATLAVRRNTDIANENSPLVLEGRELELTALRLAGENLSSDNFTQTPDSLLIHSLPDDFTLEIENIIHPEKNTELSGLYRSKKMFCTQCEAQGFRRITYFPDRPDVMAKFTTTIIADKKQYPVLLSNGNCIDSGTIDNDEERHFATWEDPWKKPSYLFALVAGELVGLEDHYLTQSGRLVKLKFFVEWENQDKCAHAISALKKAMKWDEVTYGREYDLDIYMIVAANDFNMGAMENKGLNIFNAKYILARPETATDRDFQNIDLVVGHEYFHNWSGNRVTCRDWFQLSLKEGLTVFREHHFMDDLTQSAVSLIEHAANLRGHQFSEDAGPLAHPVRPDSYVEINNFYTSTVYEKGAEVIRMIRTIIGWDNFRKGMDLYFERFDGQAVTCDDFVQAMMDASNTDLTQFKLWYTQAGTPEITVQELYDEKTRNYYLTLKQYCPPTPNQTEKHPMHIPIKIGLLNSTGENILDVEDNDVLHLKEQEQTFEFTDLPEKPILSVLRDFSAPVKIKSPLSDQQLAFLYAHDTDAFNRWDAGQLLSERFILKLVQDHQAQKPLKMQTQWRESHQAVLRNTDLNPALKAELLNLPSSSYLMELMQPADPDALFVVKHFLRTEFSKIERQQFWDQYHQYSTPGRYHYSTELAAKRSFKNLCLFYLLQNPDAEGLELCMKQWRHADNMTDSFAVLGILSDIECKEREELLFEFYDRWMHDPLVINKWLRVQASSILPTTLQTVKNLLQHPAFDLTNPNKVYSLIGAFSGNLLCFHDKSGEGYIFLADMIIKLNALNPQVASRMMDAFTRWRKFDASRQDKMRHELERIKSTPNLSKDVLEVVDKCLSH